MRCARILDCYNDAMEQIVTLFLYFISEKIYIGNSVVGGKSKERYSGKQLIFAIINEMLKFVIINERNINEMLACSCFM